MNKITLLGLGLTALALLLTSNIPTLDIIKGYHSIALSLSDGLLVGWADRIITALFYSDTQEMKDAALKSFHIAAHSGEKLDSLSIPIAIAMLIGSLFSIGGVIAVFLARNADSVDHAFKLGFFAEIAEGVIYHAGYYATMQKSGLSLIEVGLTVVIAVIMGLVATKVYKSRHG